MFIPQPEKAASEMRRVTRPGGTVAACTWDSGGGGLEKSEILWQEARKLDPAAEARANQRCARKGELAAVWEATGLEEVTEVALEMRTDFSCFDDYWLPYCGGVAPRASTSRVCPWRAATRCARRFESRYWATGPTVRLI